MSWLTYITHGRHFLLCINFQERLTLFFDCIQLVPEEDVHLGVKLWHFTRRQAVQSACITRHKRSLPVSKSCERALGEIQCSEEQTKPLSFSKSCQLSSVLRCMCTLVP